MSDIFGQPLPPDEPKGSIRARLLYARGDACPANSEARAKYYRAAGRAQRQWDERRRLARQTDEQPPDYFHHTR